MMTVSIFEGAAVALITPFTKEGQVNDEKLEELIEEQIVAGSDAIVICGTTGESATLTKEEHRRCIEIAVQKTNKRIPVIAGSGSNCTETAIALSKNAQRAGADALLLVTPYYNKTTQKGLKQHYSEIAKSVDLPMILYNVPSRTGCNIMPETAVWLSKNIEQIVGIKEASGNISQAVELMALAQGELDLYSGNDDQVIPMLSIGGKGVISVASNLIPKQMHEMVFLYQQGKQKQALQIQLQYQELIKALFCEVNPIPVKTALNWMGKQVGPLRLPLTDMEQEQEQALIHILQKHFG